MTHVFARWATIAYRLARASHRLYLFDIDGTLAPISKIPSKARLSPSLRPLLQRLANQPHATVGIVSGRRLKDARQMIGLPGLVYAGNHGLELAMNGRVHRPLKSAARQAALRRVRSLAQRLLRPVAGAQVEWKALSLSLHYRRVAPADRPRFKAVIHEAIVPGLADAGLRMRRGKMVFEILPADGGDKGDVVRYLAKVLGGPVIVYVGDDVTDETAFAALQPDDVSVRIGHRLRSSARYYLRHQREVENLINRMLE